MADFDPYLEWLGIPAMIRPLNHYLILGVKLFESDEAQITQACDSRLELLKKFQSGPRGEASQVLAGEVAMAKRVLLTPESRASYDRDLKQALQQADPQIDPNENELQAPAQQGTKQEWDQAALLNVTPNSNVSSPVVGEQPAFRKSESPDSLKAQAKTNRSIVSADHDEEDEPSSLLEHLPDLRIVMALVSLSVIVMTVTVLALRGAGKNEPSTPEQEVQTTASNENEKQPEEPIESLMDNTLKENSNPEPSLNRVPQASDDSISIPFKSASLSGASLERRDKELSGWEEGDTCTWMLSTVQRRKGYFNIRVTYTAKYESRFSVQFDEKPRRVFTLYPHATQFTEEFIVRLAKKEEQLMTLAALKGNPAGRIKITRIELSPTD